MLNCDKIRKELSTTIFGTCLYCFEEVESTNTYMLKLAREGAPEGTLVCANYQSAGRGRMQRNWFSSPGQNLLFSILLRPERDVEFAQKLTLGAATVLAESIENYLKNYGNIESDIQVKWPNDVLMDGRKVSGILTESILRDKKIEAMAMGFGINVNMRRKALPAEFREQSTSLIEYVKKTVEREHFLQTFLQELENSYFQMERSNYLHVVEDWKKRCRQFGKKITVIKAGEQESGMFKDVNNAGHLVYEDANGTLKELIAGEIRQENHAAGH